VIQPCDDVRKEVGAARELETLFLELTDDAAAVTDEARTMAALEGARMRIALERSIAGAAAGILALIVCGIIGALAAVRLVNGIAGGVARATGEGWVGDLAVGLGVLGLFAGGGAFLWRWRDNRRLAELKREFPEPAP
jgi:protein-S-isoprenylcysteine O-methyltransferase Ste14